MTEKSEKYAPHIANENRFLRRDSRRFTFMQPGWGVFPNGLHFRIAACPTDWYEARNYIMYEDEKHSYFSEYELENGIVFSN